MIMIIIIIIIISAKRTNRASRKVPTIVNLVSHLKGLLMIILLINFFLV